MNTFKESIKLKLPKQYEKYLKLKNTVRIKLFNKPNEVVFREIYKSNFWEDSESISGLGSSKQSTEKFTEGLINLIKKYKIKTFTDVPCGDFNWMKDLKLPVEKYNGFDIVEDLIKINKKKFEKENITFGILDITKDELPESDMIFCRDCLVHLSNSKVKKAFKNFKKSGSRFLMTTTYTQTTENIDILTGDWRKVNPEVTPFNFPPPIELLFENCHNSDKNGEQSKDKYLGIWDLNQIKF